MAISLARLVLRLGSVNAVAEMLSNAGGAARIYPNRIHGLLTDDESRGVNSGTLETLETAIASVDEPDSWAIDPDDVRAALQEQGDPAGEFSAPRVAEMMGVPIGVVRAVIDTSMGKVAAPTAARIRSEQRGLPDWSWQNDAVKLSLAGLHRAPGRKVGLVIPTGGGKTRVALRVGMEWLASHDGVVLWVTHRHHLRKQARRTLQRLVREAGVASESAASAFGRIRFTMTHGLSNELAALGSTLTLFIVDEAHHAAAPSYQPLFDLHSVPGLFLTATPNRTDELPLGIDEIAYTTTYRELFTRRCVIEPVFDPPEEMPNLDWATPEGVRNLADYLLERAETDFAKPLVAVSRQERAKLLYEAVLDQLDLRATHPLSPEDIGFVHSSRNSLGLSDTSEFLDEFSSRPAGILIATSQLVGEGFDDPSIDAAVITYPSVSIGHLMQVAGRALRWAPGKSTAHVVQVRQSPLEYHFEQRWLYQDISDALRPDLLDLNYSSHAHLARQVTELLGRHNVADNVLRRIEGELEEVEAGEQVSLLLSGLNYYGPSDAFGSSAQWGAILVSARERERLVRVFNDISARTEDIRDTRAFLSTNVNENNSSGSLWRSYSELVSAMEYARREIKGFEYYGRESRGYTPGRATTWLRYVTFEFRPSVPLPLDAFFADVFNREALLSAYVTEPSAWRLALRMELPVFGAEGFLLDAEDAKSFLMLRSELIERLRACDRQSVLGELYVWRTQLEPSPFAVRLLDNISQFLRADRTESALLEL